MTLDYKIVKKIVGKSVFCLIFLSILAMTTNAQSSDPKLKIRNNQLVSAWNLYPDHEACAPKQFIGTVTKVENTGEWVELTVRVGKSVRTMSLQFSNRADMSFIIPFLKRKKIKISFGVYECGSGGFLYVDSIK